MENPEKFFDTLKLVIGKIMKPSIPTENSVNENIVQNIDFVSVLNRFFSSIGLQLLNAIGLREPVALDDVDFSMSFKPVNLTYPQWWLK